MQKLFYSDSLLKVDTRQEKIGKSPLSKNGILRFWLMELIMQDK